ncbi:hypothetical protein Tco_1042870 [Tanacetum coccineum]|uniref:Uncharacterized protein n=1 Tax=Tanacetum coccineum TaxID=301880 RepID=A0ABQ5GKE5_9ASTR
MVEPEKPKKKKDQIEYDADVAQRLQAELDEEARLEREREEEASKAANISEWDDVQAMMDADYELATKLQEQDREEFTIEERSKLFLELMNERKKHFARLKAEEQRRKPPTKTQKRNLMSTYLKNMAGYKHTQLKNKKLVKGSELIKSEVDRAVPELASGSSKRDAEEELDQESSKRQKTGESSELAEETRDKEVNELSQEELQQMMIIVPEQRMNVEALQTIKPLPLIPNARGLQVIPSDHFINNDLEYLKGGSLSQRYTTSITKTKAADYGYVKWIEDKVPGKLTNLNLEERYALNVALRMYARRIVIQERVEDLQLGVESYQNKINLSRPETYRSNLKKMIPYTAYPDIQGIICQDDMHRNCLMRIEELHKFSDGTLNYVHTALNDIATGI